ncbi:MAG TPA: hypothetical protein VNR00_10260 [Opitutus sp.]|nr:hypothetical protein [Opitutus sp.]
MFSAAKDALTSRAAQTFINQRIARYGEVKSLKLDSRTKSGEVVCQLIGEPTPITVRIERYELEQREGQTYLRVGACSSNRVWLQNLLTDLAREREIPVPPWAASAL